MKKKTKYKLRVDRFLMVLMILTLALIGIYVLIKMAFEYGETHPIEIQFFWLSLIGCPLLYGLVTTKDIDDL